jgi:hypothetical protein
MVYNETSSNGAGHQIKKCSDQQGPIVNQTVSSGPLVTELTDPYKIPCANCGQMIYHYPCKFCGRGPDAA